MALVALRYVKNAAKAHTDATEQVTKSFKRLEYIIATTSAVLAIIGLVLVIVTIKH